MRLVWGPEDTKYSLTNATTSAWRESWYVHTPKGDGITVDTAPSLLARQLRPFQADEKTGTLGRIPALYCMIMPFWSEQHGSNLICNFFGPQGDAVLGFSHLVGKCLRYFCNCRLGHADELLGECIRCR